MRTEGSEVYGEGGGGIVKFPFIIGNVLKLSPCFFKNLGIDMCVSCQG